MVRHSTTTASLFSVFLAALMFSLSLAGVATVQGNTRLGIGALQNNTAGGANTAIGFDTLLMEGRPAHSAEAEKPEYDFVQTANEAFYNNGVLTLHGVGPVTVYFSQRPDRVVGQIEHEILFKLWSQGPDSFSTDPPNAGITYMDQGVLTIAIVELTNPVLRNDEIHYNAKVLAGSLPPQLGQVSLFIDPGGLMCLVCDCCLE